MKCQYNPNMCVFSITSIKISSMCSSCIVKSKKRVICNSVKWLCFSKFINLLENRMYELYWDSVSVTLRFYQYIIVWLHNIITKCYRLIYAILWSIFVQGYLNVVPSSTSFLFILEQFCAKVNEARFCKNTASWINYIMSKK